jgi:tetrapyrrole methylase family protein/MazG family protein
MTQGITLLGLGSGDPKQLTLEAKEVLENISELYTRFDRHPALEVTPVDCSIHTLDNLEYSQNISDESRMQIADQIVSLGRRTGGVVYAVPGSPRLDDTAYVKIAKKALELGIPLRVIEGISILDKVFQVLSLDSSLDFIRLDALELSNLHHPNFPPTFPVIITYLGEGRIAEQVMSTLVTIYQLEKPINLVISDSRNNFEVKKINLQELPESIRKGEIATVYIPPLAPDASFESFQEVVASLRAPDGCEWDRKQTHKSLRKALLEETYEALKAIDEDDSVKLSEELGDILLQIVLHAQIGYEKGDFSMVDVLRGINQKIVRRHPHVFGDVKLESMDHLLVNWEKLKAEERKANGNVEKSLLDGVPDILPALIQAQEVQDRAARVGFDWKDIRGVLDKIMEEIQEVDDTTNQSQLAEEIGDLLFAVVNYARWGKVDAEFALQNTNQKFRKRFGYIESKTRQQGRELGQLSFDELNEFWDEAKNE